MSRRMWMVAAGGWVAVVILGSALTWLAIDRAGQQVTGAPGSAATTQPPLVGSVGTPPTGRPSAPSSPAATTPGSPTSSVGVTGTPVVTTRPAPRPSGSSATAPRTSRPVVRTETRTWTGAAGWVTVACTGSRVALKGASPNDGWSLERGDGEGDDVEVKFTSGDTEVQVKATCVGGVPRFAVESGGDDH